MLRSGLQGAVDKAASGQARVGAAESVDPTSWSYSSRLLLVLSVNPFNALSLLSIVNMQVSAPSTSV